MAALTLILALCYSLCDPSAYLNCSLSHGQLLSNDALLLLCFRKSLLFIQFVAVSCHMATGPRCLQTVICSEGRDVRLIVDPFFRKQSDKVVTFSSAGLTFCL